MDDSLERNEATARRLVLVGLLPTIVLDVVVVVAVWSLLGWLAAVIVLVVGVASAAIGVRAQRRDAARSVLAAAGARPLAPADEPRLANLVEGLCVGIGLEQPRLWVVDDPAANALAVACAVDDADLVVTRGLLDRLSLVELEAVIAHELARIRRGDAIVGTLAGSSLGGLAFVPTPRRSLVGPALAAPVTRAIVGRGEPIESWSDLAAVEITRYPPGLATALATLAEDPHPVPASRPAVAHLWIHGARAEGSFGEALGRVYEAAPPTGPRIEVLEEL